MNSRFIALGSLIRQYRVSAGLTQADLAGQLGYRSAQFVSNWERGVSSPPMDVLAQVTDLCKIPKESIVDIIVEETRRDLRRRLYGQTRVRAARRR
jgi:transcriptional regulator with XRE-family HTH domain